MSLPFFDDFRLKFTVAVTGDRYLTLAVIAGDSLFTITISAVARIMPRAEFFS